MQFRQEQSEPFWRYFKRFKDLLAQGSHHGIEKWSQCQILYDGLDYQTKILLETMCQGGFWALGMHDTLSKHMHYIGRQLQ